MTLIDSRSELHQPAKPLAYDLDPFVLALKRTDIIRACIEYGTPDHVSFHYVLNDPKNPDDTQKHALFLSELLEIPDVVLPEFAQQFTPEIDGKSVALFRNNAGSFLARQMISIPGWSDSQYVNYLAGCEADYNIPLITTLVD